MPLLASRRNRKALTAASQRIPVPELARILRATAATDDWQKIAWDFYDEVGELRFGVGWASNSCSRVRLFPAKSDDTGDSEPVATNDPYAEQLVADLYGGPERHSQMLARISTHLSVAGESFLVVYDDPKQPQNRLWHAASREEFILTGADAELRISPIESVSLDPATSSVMRIWRPHPRRAWEADSPVRALRVDLAKIRALNGCVLAQADSRMAGAGILCIPESATLAPMPGSKADPDSDPFTDVLMRAMVTAISDRDAASSVVPIVVRMPDKAARDVVHITTATPFDAQIPVLTDQALKKLALGLDIPPEILLGLGDVNHWSADQISTEAVTLHIAPIVEIIVSALSDQYFIPLMAAAGKPTQGLMVWYDTSELVDHPNRGPEALALYDKGLVSEDCVRRENGFGDGDRPTDAERLDSLLWNIARSPLAAPVVLPLLGFPVPPALEPKGLTPTPVEPNPDQGPAVTQDDRGVPTTKPTNLAPGPVKPALPAGRASLDPGMSVAAELAVVNVLERTGKRLLTNQNRGQFRDVTAAELHTAIPVDIYQARALVEGAFDALTAAGAPQWLAEACQAYTELVMVRGVPHSQGMLGAALELARNVREPA